MNKDIMRKVGFVQEVQRVQDKTCPICRKAIDNSEFTDALSRTEYSISGMCQKCQNDIFN